MGSPPDAATWNISEPGVKAHEITTTNKINAWELRRQSKSISWKALTWMVSQTFAFPSIFLKLFSTAEWRQCAMMHWDLDRMESPSFLELTCDTIAPCCNSKSNVLQIPRVSIFIPTWSNEISGCSRHLRQYMAIIPCEFLNVLHCAAKSLGKAKWVGLLKQRPDSNGRTMHPELAPGPRRQSWSLLQWYYLDLLGRQ